MKLESYGILISIRPFAERDAIAHIFSRDYGIMCGMMRGAQVAKKNKPLMGQVGLLSWNARLEDQLGVFHWEAKKNLAAPLMQSSETLGVMNSAFSLIYNLLPEREKYYELFLKTEDLLRKLGEYSGLKNQEEKEAIKKLYIDWEINLIQELGYALDLRSCSNCKTDKNLNYLSPNTGRAVCDNCAAPYMNQVVKLPFDLDILKKFLENICRQQGVELPLMRKIISI